MDSRPRKNAEVETGCGGFHISMPGMDALALLVA